MKLKFNPTGQVVSVVIGWCAALVLQRFLTDDFASKIAIMTAGALIAGAAYERLALKSPQQTQTTDSE